MRLARRGSTRLRPHAALAALLALGCAGGEPAEPSAGAQGGSASWETCRVAADCVWTIGEGGWPVAVNAERESAYLERVRSMAPFTTYFTPGDCFARSDEFAAYVSRSRSSIACAAGRCTLEAEPSCTK